MNDYIVLGIASFSFICLFMNIFSYKKDDGYVLTFISMRNSVYFLVVLVIILNLNNLFLDYKDKLWSNEITLKEKVSLIEMTKTDLSKEYLKEKLEIGITNTDIKEIRHEIGRLNKI